MSKKLVEAALFMLLYEEETFINMKVNSYI